MNRRKFFSIKLAYPEALITGLIDGKAQRFGVRLVDLSGGGAYILTSSRLDVNDPIRLHLPAGREMAPLDLPARVVHVKRVQKFWQIGLRFTSLSEITQELKS